jgi:hypothetical protein
VQIISDILTASGVPASILKLDPVATAKPLSSPDPQEHARINRSVSFDVAFSDAPLQQEERR